jgi:N6-adenosine-specific RNA methylase IME4
MANELMRTIAGGIATATALELPDDLTEAKWRRIGEQLGFAERAVGWWIGDWWNRGERYGNRVGIVTAKDWQGPSHAVCRNYGSVAARFDVSRRHDTLPFKHHAEVAALETERAAQLLGQAAGVLAETGKLPPSRMLRQEVKRIRRDERETSLAVATAAASAELGSKLYNVIYADPPWQFEPYSQDSGMDRSAANHYSTMPTDLICEIKPPAAPDCILFLWATPPMLQDALDVMDAWGFDYRSHFAWTKDRAGTGYWNRQRHELLLIGVRGEVPAPAPGDQYDSVIPANAREHSEKPACFAEMIESMFPHAALLEMFARGPRLGWDVWGNESGADATVSEAAEAA